jgi:exodeoxyribonuclease VII small subunit
MNDPAPSPLTFEQALTELDRIVRELEDGKVGLEDSLARYEQGVALLKQCYGQLRKAEQRIQELVGVDEQGNPVTRPFDHTASVDKKNGQ